jgi:hypothetical protein
VSRALLVLHACQSGDPIEKREIIEETAEQCEFQMGMGVYEARDNGATRIASAFDVRRELIQPHVLNATSIDGHAPVLDGWR